MILKKAIYNEVNNIEFGATPHQTNLHQVLEQTDGKSLLCSTACGTD